MIDGQHQIIFGPYKIIPFVENGKQQSGLWVLPTFCPRLMALASQLGYGERIEPSVRRVDDRAVSYARIPVCVVTTTQAYEIGRKMGFKPETKLIARIYKNVGDKP